MRQSKHLRIIIFVLVLLVLCPSFFLAYYIYDNRLFVIEAQVLLGAKQFSEIEFLNGTSSVRASMAADILKSKRFIGTKCDSLTTIIGKQTGDYYHSDSNATYLLTEKASANWILTFICGDSGTIEKAIIRKSCCSTSQKMLNWGIEALRF